MTNFANEAWVPNRNWGGIGACRGSVLLAMAKDKLRRARGKFGLPGGAREGLNVWRLEGEWPRKDLQ